MKAETNDDIKSVDRENDWRMTNMESGNASPDALPLSMFVILFAILSGNASRDATPFDVNRATVEPNRREKPNAETHKRRGKKL